MPEWSDQIDPLARLGERENLGPTTHNAHEQADPPALDESDTERPPQQRVKRLAHAQIAIPPMSLCTDNAAMIGGIAWHQLQAGERTEFDRSPEPNWPLATAVTG